MADLANLRISIDSRAVKDAARDLNSLGTAANSTETSVKKTSSAFAALGGVLASLGIAAIAREAILMADTFTRMNGQLALVTNNAQQLAAAESQLFLMSQKTRVGYETTVSLFTRLARSTENLGVSQQEVMRVTETINKAMVVSGTSAEQASGALMQLGQAFASGTLRGDELNSVMEGMPRVAQAIADGMGITVGELRKLGAQGKLTGAEVFTALQKMGADIDSEFSKMPMTVGQSMTVLNNSFMIFIAEVNKATGFTAALADGIVWLSENLNQIARVVEVVMVAVAGMAAAFVAFRAALAIQALVLYITQTMALNIALGATSTASALAGVGIKALQAALASTGFGLAVVAIGALVGVMYSLATAQETAIEKTRTLAQSLYALADARSADFASQRMQLQNDINAKKLEIQAAKDAQKAGGGARYNTSNVANLEWQLIALQGTADGADYRLKKANETMSNMGKIAPVAAEGVKRVGKAAKEAVDPLEKYRDALAGMVEEGKKIGLPPEAIKKLEVEKLATEAAAAGHVKYKNATQQGAGKEIADRILKQGMLNALNQYAADIQQTVSDKLKDYAKTIADNNKAHSERMITLKDEAALIGLVGVEREKEALLLEKTSYELKYGTKAWEEYYAARLAGIDKQSVFDKDLKDLQTLTNNLETAAGMIGGKGGRALQGIFKMEFELADGTTQKISEAIAKSFPQLGGVLAKVISGMQIGNLVGGMVGSKTGGTIGGGLGGALGKKLLTGTLTKIAPELAKFAGPLGALAGGILGGVIGGLMKKTKTGSVTLSQIAGGAMQRTLTGNSAQLKDIANNMANGLLKGLGNIAEQLGGELGGNVKVSLGMRKKDYVVDPTGAGRTKGSGVKNFGTDEAAAIAYVTQLAIQQGIVTGISAGAQTLIRASDDLNAQVQKALKFDQVFKDLVKETDPLRSSLDELSVEMEKLKVIFAEAGASAADYAKLEELYAIKQAKAVFEAARPRRELEIQLMEAQGDAAGSLAAQRALELEGMDANLRALQQQVWSAEDAKKATEDLAEAQTKAAEEAAQIAEDAISLARDRRSLEIDLMDALGNSTDALVARRAFELESIDETLRGLQAQIWAAQDAKEASEAAAEAAKVAADAQAQAMETAAKLADDRRELEIQLMEAQGMAVEALAARRSIELEVMDASLRGLKEQIWAAQAKSEADELAAKVAAERAETEAKAADDAAQAMQKYMETLADVSQTVVDEINRLRGINTASSSALLKAQFATLTAQARTGNLDALGKLPELSRSIEEATLGTATSALEVARIRAWLDASLSETLASQGATGNMVNATSTGLTFDGNSTASANAEQTSGELSNMSNVLYTALYQVAKNTGKSFELLDRWDGDGLPDIREDVSDYY